VIDAVVRQLPGAVGDADSVVEESFVKGLLDHPHDTRPEVYRGMPVPPVLLSGHHELIRLWRLKEAMLRTWERRPDLFARWLKEHRLTPEEARLWQELKRERGIDGDA